MDMLRGLHPVDAVTAFVAVLVAAALLDCWVDHNWAAVAKITSLYAASLVVEEITD